MYLTSGKTQTINFASANQMPDGTKFANELKKAVYFALLKIGSFEIFLFTTIILHILNVSQHLSFPVSSTMPLLVPALAFRFPRMLWSSRVRLSPRTPPRHRYSRGLTICFDLSRIFGITADASRFACAKIRQLVSAKTSSVDAPLHPHWQGCRPPSRWISK